MTSPDITLQINLAPSDARIAKYLLPHQVGLFSSAVRKVTLTVDDVAGGGKFAGQPAQRTRLDRIIEDVEGQFDNVNVQRVRYDQRSTQAVSDTFFNGNAYGLKDRRGGPCHCYLDALLAVDTKFVMHIDSDMLFGGEPGPWFEEALTMLEDRRIIAVNPLGGPPGSPEAYQAHRNPERIEAGYLFPELSTRIFFTNIERFIESLCPLPAARRFAPSERIERWLGGHPNQELPEILLSRAMRDNDLARLDMLGSGAGLWALHPVHKTNQFVELLPALLSSVESGDVPPEQRGRYDLTHEFAPLADLPGFKQKVGHWLARTPRQSRTSRS